jgi:hypothetical protein
MALYKVNFIFFISETLKMHEMQELCSSKGQSSGAGQRPGE